MNKRIIICLLLITNTLTYGMKRPNIFHNNGVVDASMVLINGDFIPQITTALCSGNEHLLRDVKKTVGTLSCTHTFLRDYYAQEKVKQNIIRLCSDRLAALNHFASNDKYVAEALGCKKIVEKIEYFTTVALDEKKDFTEEDLKEKWYLTMTTNFWSEFLCKPEQRSLLQLTINNAPLKKVNSILDNTKELKFRYNTQENILYNIVEERAHIKNQIDIDFQRLDDLISIARRLLERNFLVDGRIDILQQTPLIRAVMKEDEPCVRLFLEYNANPCLVGSDSYANRFITAFDYEPEKGWLQKIIDEVNTSKKFKITQSPTDQSAAQ